MVWFKRLGAVVLVLAFLAGGATWLWWATGQFPDFYRAAEKQVADPVVRKRLSQEFIEQSQHFAEEMKSLPNWSQEFTDTQINSWLAEGFRKESLDLIPPGVSEPRVKVQRDGIRFGVKVDQPGRWAGIVSVHGQVRVVVPNELEIELHSIHAGLVPVPLKSLTEQITEHARRNRIEIDWRQDGDHLVAVVRTSHDALEAPKLEQVELRDGIIRISGSSSPKPGAMLHVPRRLLNRSQSEAD